MHARLGRDKTADRREVVPFYRRKGRGGGEHVCSPPGRGECAAEGKPEVSPIFAFSNLALYRGQGMEARRVPWDRSGAEVT